MQWFCKLCWRHGAFFIDLPPEEAIRQATMTHDWEVALDMRAGRVVAGMQKYRDTAIMDKYKSVHCEGDIEVGPPKIRKPRFDKKSMPTFEFDTEE